MWKEFRAFAIKGNVMDLAIGVVIGTAFSKIVSSLVEDLIMPLFAYFVVGVDFSSWSYASIKYGSFLQTIVDFFIISFSIFLVIRFLNKFKKKEEVKEETVAVDTKEELLKEIRDLLKAEAIREKE
ncbi:MULTISPECIES: large conductance mechanosensitive channel protein MscL [unclassified Niallia]|uniref:large conductance mechanosensitive channel protein MscL n=1 Tax=unclassified Niallia TaxID=2837522 RepID=UPI000332A4BA|nr:large conductance mechanosensitive channel protein MscL [Niallia sp. RD1]EOR24404.1 large-conductance mechanosensitive channel [Niallia nealsonii AAU1]UTI43992.1 large conductance mechanosensitive channel protein MscL [Niallia sp. RD1]